MKVPKGKSRIGDICEFSSGNGFGPKDWKPSGLPIIRIQNLNGSPDFNYFDGTPDPDWIVEPGELLFAWAGVKGVSFGPCLWRGPKGVLNQHIYRIRPAGGVDINWLNYALMVVTSRIESKAHGFKSSLVHVRKSDITGEVVSFPPLPEQRRIATVLGALDRAIETQQKLITAKTARLRTLRHQLLTGTRRFPEFQGKWRKALITELFTRVERKAAADTPHVLSITAGRGFVDQREKFSKVIAGRNIANYILLRHGEFAYNKGNSDMYPQGCIYRLSEFEEGAVPNVWISFRASTDAVDPEFYKHFFLSGGLNSQLAGMINSGVRNDGLLNIRPDAFFSVQLPVPHTKGEQTRIATVLNAAQREIDLLTTQLESLKQQKRGLMQKLLTGEVRVHSTPADPNSE